MASKKMQAQKLRAQIAKLRDQIALTDSQEESQMYTDQMFMLKEQLKMLNRKDPVVVPVKHASTMGDRKERRLKNGKNMSSTYTRTTVKL